jgi:branched-chain amino acid transport system ATP-binding protein
VPTKAPAKSVAAKPVAKAAAPKTAAKTATKPAAAKATPEKAATKTSAAKSATKVTVKPVASQPVKASAKPTPKVKPEKPTQPKKPDNLKLIKGIGPVNDRKLRAHGITTFAQIAAWKKADIIEAEKYLEFDGRIAREDWVGQAKNLAKGGKPLPGGEK